MTITAITVNLSIKETLSGQSEHLCQPSVRQPQIARPQEAACQHLKLMGYRVSYEDSNLSFGPFVEEKKTLQACICEVICQQTPRAEKCDQSKTCIMTRFSLLSE